MFHSIDKENDLLEPLLSDIFVVVIETFEIGIISFKIWVYL